MKQEFCNISLLERNSFRIDQRAARLIEWESTEDLLSIFEGGEATAPSAWYVLSGGNNVLFTEDYAGTILTPKATSIEVLSRDRLSAKVRVAAGVEWDDFVEWTTEQELWGVENLSLIPGKVGAAPVQNIGAYGVEVGDVIESVEMFCPSTLNTLRLSAAHCNFGYRDSVFKGALKGKTIITHVTFTLSTVAAPKLG